MTPLRDNILRTLLYYDIWHHPLTAEEVYRYLPVNSLAPHAVRQFLQDGTSGGEISALDGYYFVRGRSAEVVANRLRREAHARRLWRVARISMHVIRRFPYVRGVFVSGDLSKNSTGRESDVDFFIITAPGRLWIARTALIAFKKIFLLNRKKYFCLNSFVSEDRMTLDEENIFLATEIATLKPLYNSDLFLRYMRANDWILRFFPNLDPAAPSGTRVCDRRSVLQRFAERLLEPFPMELLDLSLQRMMQGVWERRYADVDAKTRARNFRSTRTESRAYAGNFQERILALYAQRLSEFGVRP